MITPFCSVTLGGVQLTYTAVELITITSGLFGGAVGTVILWE